jgi:hypothetical protein
MADVRTARLQTNVENTVRGTYNDPIVIGALIGSLFLVSYADYKDGNFPPQPKRILALLLVYGILGVVTVSDNRLGRSFSVLILVGLIVKEWPKIKPGSKGKPVISKAQALAANAELTQKGGFGFDFPLPNPVAKKQKKPLKPPLGGGKTGRGTHN